MTWLLQFYSMNHHFTNILYDKPLVIFDHERLKFAKYILYTLGYFTFLYWYNYTFKSVSWTTEEVVFNHERIWTIFLLNLTFFEFFLTRLCFYANIFLVEINHNRLSLVFYDNMFTLYKLEWVSFSCSSTAVTKNSFNYREV